LTFPLVPNLYISSRVYFPGEPMAEDKNEKERLIKEKDREQLQKHFQKLKNPVELLFFTQDFECQFCRETRALLSEVSTFSEKISLSVYDFQKDTSTVTQFSIDKIPATAILKEEKDYGIRFFGVPTGYEFTPLILAITTVSQGTSMLKPETRKTLSSLKEDIHIQVFTTPTCPYCPQAVQIAHQAAIESDYIRADMVESIEFPHLANKYDVFAVPKVIINETHTFEGVLPEEKFAEEIIKATQ